jgi:hypothetical protein
MTHQLQRCDRVHDAEASNGSPTRHDRVPFMGMVTALALQRHPTRSVSFVPENASSSSITLVEG